MKIFRFKSKYGSDNDYATIVDNAYYGNYHHFQKMKVHEKLTTEYLVNCCKDKTVYYGKDKLSHEQYTIYFG